MHIAISNRRRTALALTLLIVALTPSCKRHKSEVETIEEPAQLASMIHVADPNAASQLLTGFYGVEQNAWRWTAQKFTAVLRPPKGAADKGATLVLKLTVTDGTIANLHDITLSASVNGAPLAPETYAKAGSYTYTRDVPASALTGDVAKVAFSLDKVMQPGNGDVRSLGLVVGSLGFEAK
jgi:hypothetical protein